MLYIDDIIPMRMYKKQFILPLNLQNKFKGSAVMLLTPNYQSTINVLKNKFINQKYYESYYIEKDISAYITEKNTLIPVNDEDFVLNESIIYSGDRYSINMVSKTITGSLVEQLCNSYTVDIIDEDFNVNIYPSYVDRIPYSDAYEVNVYEYTAKKFSQKNPSVYAKYLRANLMMAIARALNPEMYVGFLEGICYCESGYELNLGLDVAKKVGIALQAIENKYGHTAVVKIIRDNNIRKYQEYLVRMGMNDLCNYVKNEYLTEDKKLNVSTSIEQIVRKIKRNNRKSIYKTNALKRIQDINDPHKHDGTIEGSNKNKSSESNGQTQNSQEEQPEEREQISDNAVLDLDINNDDIQIDENYIRNGDHVILFENDDTIRRNKVIKNYIYKERLRTNSDVFAIHDRIKEELPFIKYTHLNYEKYLKRNLFIDFSYYNTAFFKNNMFKLDRGVNLYLEFLNRLINDKRIYNAGYKKKFVIIPVNDWFNNPSTKMWMYTEDINPISIMFRLIKKDLHLLKSVFKDTDFLFLGDIGYFKMSFNDFKPEDSNKFLKLIKRLNTNNTESDPDDDNTPDKDSAKVMTINTIEKLEKAKGIKINNISAINNIKTPGINIVKPIKNYPVVEKDNTDKKSDEEILDDKKEDLVNAVAYAAEKSNSEEEFINNMDDNEQLTSTLADIAATEGNDKGISNARASRIVELNKKFNEKEYNGQKISDIINKPPEPTIEKTTINIDTVNEDIKNLTFINMDKNYDPNNDIIKMLNFLATRSYPIGIRDLTIKDASTSEDYIDNYNVQMEDSFGKRFTLNFDIPKFKDDKYMILRGNKKTISNQLFLMPLSKSDEDKAQIVSNYSKIFIERFVTSTGKSTAIMGRIIKALNKQEYKDIKVTRGNNSRICKKYDLPIDYIDIASVFSTISITNEYQDKIEFYFNQDKLRELFGESKNGSVIIGVRYPKGSKQNKEVLYMADGLTFGDFLYGILSSSTEFVEVFKKCTAPVRNTYSRCSILNTDIPLIIVCAYSVGLTETLKRAGVEYSITEKKPKDVNDLTYETIKFMDGYLTYKYTYSSSLLMNGLKAVPLTEYSIFDMDKKTTYINMLDLFGGRIKADGLDNFYDMMIDPITEESCIHYKLPTDYIGLLLKGNDLLADNKYIKHTDTSSKRIRRKELVAGYTYLCLAREYGNYCNRIKHGNQMPMTMRKSAVIDAIMQDPTMGDLSVLNPLLEAESYNAISTKGLTGMNSDRAYSMDKRGYDDSMHNIIAMSTGFAGNVGVTRQVTIDANIESNRGYINPNLNDEDEFSTAKTLSITEAITPFGTTRDDPFRSAMNFIQRSKHGVRTVEGTPSLITNGSDEAMPYIISDMFAFKAKEAGEVVEKTDSYMIVKYNSERYDYINLAEEVEKNSNGGFFVTIKNTTNYKVGDKFNVNDILAYDESSFSPEIGYFDNIAYKVGTFTKIAILTTDEGYEDSTIISKHLTEAMASEQVLQETKMIPPQSSIFNLIKIGTPVEEGDTLMIVQSDFEDEDANRLMKNLIDDEEEISNLGRVNITSPITGVVQDIVIYRTVEMEELSENLQKLIKQYEKPIKDIEKKLKENHISTTGLLKPTYTLPTVGKLKNVRGILIEFYIKYYDKMHIGDKLINYAANKGVVKTIMPEGEEPTSELRPNERINVLCPISSIIGRMTTSLVINSAINKVLVELDRMNKDELGIKYDINL